MSAAFLQHMDSHSKLRKMKKHGTTLAYTATAGSTLMMFDDIPFSF
jgi:hypothetical protein